MAVTSPGSLVEISSDYGYHRVIEVHISSDESVCLSCVNSERVILIHAYTDSHTRNILWSAERADHRGFMSRFWSVISE